jgi:hypothetical protein
MPDVPQFFVIVFSRSENNRIHTEAALSAPSKQDAMWMASRFTGKAESAIAVSRTESPGLQKWARVEVLAQFGEALPIGSIDWALKKALGPFAITDPSTTTPSASTPAGTKQLQMRRSAARRRRLL